LPALIENILHVLPNTKTVAWVLGASPGEKLWLEDVRKELAPFADRLSFIWYSDRSFADWTHPFVDGRRWPYSDLPKSVDKLVDDPFRSLAGELRRAGGFAKDTTPFSEFLWADFLRRNMKRKAVETHFEHALEKALELAKSLDANYLPGWCGPVLDD